MKSLISAEYLVELRLDGVLIGDVRSMAENLTWSKKRTRVGVDSITFTLNDFLFSQWCENRGYKLADVLKPLALDCRVIRNGIPLVGGYLATMPAYEPSGNSANLNLQFDGYLNYLANVYLAPRPTEEMQLSLMINYWVNEANSRSAAAGKTFGLEWVDGDNLGKVTQSYEDYKSIKDYITNRCDNVSGAGEFEMYFNAARGYQIIKDSNFGKDESKNYVIEYPAQINTISATSLKASEVSGFASCVIGVGNGDTGTNESGSEAALISEQLNREAVKEYGYAETILSESSISVQATLDANVEAELAARSDMSWQPEIVLSGRTVNPEPWVGLHGNNYTNSPNRIWIGDTIGLQNNEDRTGMTSGLFRVNSLEVQVDATGAETITPTVSRVGKAPNTHSFALEFVRMQNELRALKAKR